HKEYHLSSGDPKIIGEGHTHPVCNTNFDVADQLADVGMEAIHPKASKPLENMRIPIRVKNAFEPEHDGTLITNDYIGIESKIEIIAGSDSISCVEIHETQMVGEVGFDLKIMQVLKNFNISYITKMTNANTIDIIINESDCTEELVNILEEKFQTVTSFKAAIVCAIGSNIAKPGIIAAATKALADEKINVLAISQTCSQTNMQFILERADYSKAQKALHRALCE
ncbi:MAG: ACT domain-containing protein, partial [Deltaproteobacteria bacterium]|nr:ACT domain-containing protein [Deltaproteobacteria bacterium]